MTVSAPIFSDFYDSTDDTNRTVYMLPQKLQDLVARLYKWPKSLAEGRRSCNADFTNFEHQLKYRDDVAGLAVDFLNSARAVYTENKAVGEIVDKPITHRLLELVMTTIPTFGHARVCSEMVLEHAHQQFK